MVPPTKIDVTNATRIAYLSDDDGARLRWTEIAVYWLGDPFFRKSQWLARWRVHSRIEGEDDRHGSESGGTLEKALRSYDQGPGLRLLRRDVETVKAQALEWREANAELVDAFYQALRG